MKYTSLQSAGFTLIEMVVALALFASVSTVSIGALLILIDSNRELRGEQELIANVSFALDMMTRDARSGYDYVCGTLTPSQFTSFMSDHFNTGSWSPAGGDCANGITGNGVHVFSFSTGRSLIAQEQERIAFIFDPNGSQGRPTILRRINNDDPQRTISSAINLVSADIIVQGTGADQEQPTATFLLVVDDGGGTNYEVQTTITQRFLDI